MKNLSKLLIFIIGMPLIVMIFIKPDTSWRENKDDTDVINIPFMVAIDEDKGKFQYEPEEAVVYMMAAIVPWDLLWEQTASDSIRQEYLKALAVVCRTNLIFEWEQAKSPEILDFDECGLFMKRLRTDAPQLDEIKRAVQATAGAVITDDEKTVIAAPFFTSSDWDIQMQTAGEGKGLSLNYSIFMANNGLNFSQILNAFFQNIKIVVMYK